MASIALITLKRDMFLDNVDVTIVHMEKQELEIRIDAQFNLLSPVLFPSSSLSYTSPTHPMVSCMEELLYSLGLQGGHIYSF